MPEMTPLEITKKLDEWAQASRDCDDYEGHEYAAAAASLLRKIVSGEYAPVVHGRWIATDAGWYTCSNCGDDCGALGDETPYTSERCPCCGAVMIGGISPDDDSERKDEPNA